MLIGVCTGVYTGGIDSSNFNIVNPRPPQRVRLLFSRRGRELAAGSTSSLLENRFLLEKLLSSELVPSAIAIDLLCIAASALLCANRENSFGNNRWFASFLFNFVFLLCRLYVTI